MSDASLAPVLLVSMPQMIDPNFSRTVVLLAEYRRFQELLHAIGPV